METNDRRHLPGALSLEMPDSVKREATKCSFDFSCLTTARCGSDQDVCKAESSVGKDRLRITAKPLVSCPYYVSSGSSHVCECPVHYYLRTYVTPCQ